MGLLDGISKEKKPEVKPEVVISPVGTPAKPKQSQTNKDGLVKGSEVGDNDYWAIINKQRAKK